jgi:nucleotide-binding universal stress UspA family protein
LIGVLIVLGVAAGLAAGVALGRWHAPQHRARRAARPETLRRILLPFTGASISRRAFDAAVRLARVENATLMPCYLATVPLNLPLDAALPAQCTRAMPLLETIEQRGTELGVNVDSRIIRGRTYRDALRRLLDEEHVDRVIVSATTDSRAGLSSDDLEWLLEKVPAEVLILRPDPEDHRAVTAAAVAGHF